MTNWKLQTETINVKDSRGQPKDITYSKGYQKDEVGNILQRKGAVIPKACQKCKKEFSAVMEQIEIKNKIPNYVCDTCNFEEIRPELVIRHTTLNPEHKIITEEKEKVVGYDTILNGTLSFVEKTSDDVIILCRDCHGIN